MHSRGQGLGRENLLEQPDTTAEDDITLLSNTLGAEITHLPMTLLTDTMEALKFSLPRQARIHVKMRDSRPVRTHDESAVSATMLLAEQFANQEKRNRDIWRPTMEALQEEWKAIDSQPDVELRNEFTELAKASSITMEDALQLHYLLFATDQQRKRWAATLMRRQGLERLKCHNFSVAAQREASFAQIHGAKLLTFQLPLFPSTQEFQALNTRLLSNMETVVQGAGIRTSSSTPNAPFKTQNHGSFPQLHDESISGTKGVEGAGYAPVGQISDGTWVADTSKIEASLKRQIRFLERRVVELGGAVRAPRGRGGERGNNRGRGGYVHGGGETQIPTQNTSLDISVQATPKDKQEKMGKN